MANKMYTGKIWLDLFYETLGIKDGEEYCLVSRNYGSPPHSEKFNMNCNTNLHVQLTLPPVPIDASAT